MSEQLTLEEATQMRDDVLYLISLDPQMSPTIRAVAAAIDKVASPGDVVSANTIRPHLPTWVKRQGIGPAFGMLVRAGALQRLAWTTSTDPGTHGKPIAEYVLRREASPEVAA